MVMIILVLQKHTSLSRDVWSPEGKVLNVLVSPQHSGMSAEFRNFDYIQHILMRKKETFKGEL